jgi:DNA repair ATPase RecN
MLHSGHMNDNQFATKQDLLELKHEIVDEVGELFVEFMNQLDTRLQNIENRLQTVKTTTERIERKLDPTIERVDGHEMQLTRLEARHLGT